jgi:hypothetical protein
MFKVVRISSDAARMSEPSAVCSHRYRIASANSLNASGLDPFDRRLWVAGVWQGGASIFPTTQTHFKNQV